jgi:Tfp pilus assembly protein PilF
MKRYEKIIILVFVYIFGLQFFDFTGKRLVFLLSAALLALSYLIGGFWILNTRKPKRFALPILAGIAFSTSVYFLPFSIWLNKKNYYDFLPIANGILFFLLGTYLLFKRKSTNVSQDYQFIFLRSFVILLLSSFFTYTPISFKPFRQIVYYLNSGYNDLQNNILIFDYIEISEEAKALGDCDKAIEYGLKANAAGKIWLGIYSKNKEGRETFMPAENTSGRLSTAQDTLNESYTNQGQLWKISGTYTNLYEAYKCKADGFYERDQFNEALYNYQIAHKFLIATDHQADNWEEDEAWSLNNVAFCYKGLAKFKEADSVFLKAIKSYKKVKANADNGLAKLYSNLSLSLSAQGEYNYSNHLYHTSNSILHKDTSDAANKKDLISNYTALSTNYLQQDSLSQATLYIQKAIGLSDDTSKNSYCITLLNYGICTYKLNDYQKADSILNSCIECFETQPKKNAQNVADAGLLLSFVSIALAKYDEARQYLVNGAETTAGNLGSNSIRYGSFLNSLAALNSIVGDYDTSKKQFRKAIDIFEKKSGNGDNLLPVALSGLADVEIKLSLPLSAKAHADSSLSIASRSLALTYPRATNFLNTSAYIDYSMGRYKSADSLYRQVLEINDAYGRNQDAETAIALNGLGLIETKKKMYIKADSLFNQSLQLHREIFSDNHPLTATVHLNLANLYIQQGNLKRAEGKINQGLRINKRFFMKEHDVFGDVYMLLGDLSGKEQQKELARHYYRKALDIYLLKFNERHWKVISIRKKIG